MSDNADDDSEEHDVLDNMDVRNIFPDLSALNKELEENCNWNNGGDDDSSMIPELPLMQTMEEKCQDHSREELYRNAAHLFDENNIIDYEQFFEEKVKIKGAQVQLDDLGSYLKRSERFCGLCHILFSSRSEYEEHNIAVHLQDCLQDCIAALFVDEIESPLDVMDNEQVYPSPRKQSDKKIVDKTDILCKPCGRVFKTVAALNFHYKIRKCIQFLPKTTDCRLAEKKSPRKPSDKRILDKTDLLCKPCGRVFKTVAALNFHYKIRKCIQFLPKTTDCSLAKNKSCQSYVKNETEKMIHSRSRVCSHCNTMFATEEALFDHMYDTEVLQTNENISCNVQQGSAIDHSIIPKITMLKKEVHNHNTRNKSTKHPFKNYKINACNNKKIKSNRNYKDKIINRKTKINPLKNLTPKENRFYYRCPVCASYFARVEKFVDHLEMNNVIKAAEIFEKVSFDPKCPHCRSIPKSFSSYKTHVISNHRQELHERYLKISQNSAKKNTKSNKKQATSMKTKRIRMFKSRLNEKSTRSRTIQDSKKKIKAHATSKIKGIKDVPVQKGTKVSRDLIVLPNISAGLSINVPDNYSKTPKEENSFVNVPYENSDNLKNSSEFGIENNVEPWTFILNSTLFKCNKCDIHFVSAKTAINHHEHMELLIHWKCSKCNRIFKKDEKETHEKQHLVSDFYRVHDLHLNNTTDLSKILYKCVSCAVHFNHFNFLSHFIKCGRKQDSVYCKHCNILIDELINESHEANHKDKDVDLKDLIIVEAEILVSSNSFEVTQNEESRGTKRKSNCNTNTQKATKKGKYDYLLNMCYCDTCQCFLTESLKRNVHMESRCSHLKKCICKLCGLVLTPRTYQSHKNMHDRIKNLQLKHFRFRDLRSGEIISPPVPTFPKCDHCDVHFPSKKACYQHECTDDQFLTCNICDKKLSEHAFKLHMAFHNFDDLNLATKIESNDESSQINHEDISIKKTNETFETSSKEMFSEHDGISDANISDSVNGANDTNWCYNMDLKTEDVSNSSRDKKEMFSEYDEISDANISDSFKGANDTNWCYNMGLKTEDVSSSSRDKKTLRSIGNGIPKDAAEHHRNQTHPTDNYDTLISDYITISNSETQGTEQLSKSLVVLTLYKCKVCQITLDTYDNVVLHCQWHYSRCQKNTIASKTCSFCLNVFESSCFNDHENWHIDHPEQDIRLLQFDVTYFRSGNDIWLNHLFGSLTKEQINEIMGKSIYKFECRIKLEVVQHGETELTVYKCEKCQCFIDESSLYRHSENSCFKLRKHPCSYCGLPFIASLAKLNHEKLHENRDNISLKSYRMVIFNRRDDEHFNNRLKSHSNYILYQCRNCNSVSEICQWSYHKCSHDLKQCQKCGLLFKNSEFESHTAKHCDLHDFVVSNMKVILYGIKIDQNDISDNKAEYQGLIKDYTFYKCNACQTSFQTMHELEEHVCSFGSHRLKCPDCDLIFPSTKLKVHRKLHEIDEDLIKENIQIISTLNT